MGLSLRQLSEIYLMLVGEWFGMKERNDLGLPVAVWPIPPNWIMATPTPECRFFQVGFRSWQGKIPETRILWASQPNPLNLYSRGSSVSHAVADESEIDEFTRPQHRNTL